MRRGKFLPPPRGRGENKPSPGAPVKARMRTQPVVEVGISAQRRAGLCDRVVGLEIDLLVFHAAPQPLDEALSRSSLAVHADGDLAIQQDARERLAGELAALIGVEYLGLAVFAEGLLQRLDGKPAST